MLFSSEAVSNLINAQFEPVWVNVREVPIVTIDFGNGSKIVRTLNGNVATYVLSNDGTVLDILPGIYKPESYLEQLDQFAKLHNYLVFQSPVERHVPNAEKLKTYHETQAVMIAAGKEPGKIVMDLRAAISKARIENPLKFAIGDAAKVDFKRNASTVTQARSKESPVSTKLQQWKEMTEDTVLNETVNRKAIHEKLAQMGPAKVTDITKWLYKNVLHADLDDPTLGLGELLNKNYPFAEEDRSTTASK